jgi:hypothetical protein
VVRSQDRDTDLTWVIDEVVRPDSLPEGWVVRPRVHDESVGTQRELAASHRLWPHTPRVRDATWLHSRVTIVQYARG